MKPTHQITLLALATSFALVIGCGEEDEAPDPVSHSTSPAPEPETDEGGGAAAPDGDEPRLEEAELPEPPREPVEIYQLTGEVEPPEVLEWREPTYPQIALDNGMEGTVILRVVIDAEGGVRVLRILRNPHSLMGEAATEAVEMWKYKPATQDGEPVPVYMNLPITFRLP